MIDLIERENDKQISGFVSACLERFVSQLKQYRQSMHYYFFTLHHHIDFDSHGRYYGLVEIIDMMLKKSLCESLLLIRMNNILWCEVPQSRTKFWLGGYDQECIARQLQVLSHTAGLLCTTCILYRNQYRNQT